MCHNIDYILCYNNAVTLLLRPVGRSGRRRGGRLGCRRSGRTGSLYGFLFSVPGNLEGLGQVQGGLVQRQAMDRSPQIQHVPLDRTLSVKALKGVLAQMDREGSLRGRGLAVHGAGTTALLAATAQGREVAQMLKHLFHGHVFAHACEVDLGPNGSGALGRWLDGRSCRL